MGELKQPSPSTKPTTQPMVVSLSCWFSAPGGLSLTHVNTLETGADMNEYRRDTRVFQHIAGCAPYRHRHGGQLPLPAKGIPTLGTLLPPTSLVRKALIDGAVISFSAALPTSPWGSDHIFTRSLECLACGL